MSYLNENFLLSNEFARKLYFDYAKDMPIFDYHCHLSEKEILANEPCKDLCDLWLGGDHYKWRLMRNFGIDEPYVTGDKSPEEKFTAFCKTLETAFGNPIYHWSQLELEDFFECDLEINEKNASAILAHANAYIKEHELTPQKLIEHSGVRYLCTTNEVADDLTVFDEIAKKDYKFGVMPAFRSDKILYIDAKAFPEAVAKLEALTGKIEGMDDLEAALESRLKEFIKRGCCASDIGIEKICPIGDRAEADRTFKKARKGETLTQNEIESYKGYLTYFLMKMYGTYHLATEVHIGPMRNNNTRMFNAIGADTGFDSISDANSITLLSRLFDRLDSEGCLPKTIVFNLNPKMNAEIMSLIGCFQTGEAKGKIQYGAAWWFLDNKVGMERHLEDMTATGHLGSFVGMLTDSRSLLSYPRHHYFRRILCNYLGTMMEKGEITQNIETVGELVRDVSYRNAVRYFGLEE
ncbi:MAG: glucuronate isomerase [Clostridia bacterium]|nr:glucuronate isomerase [Clostridia bacterium]